MDVSVFVSSTRRDMERDCRPAVLQAIGFADDILKDAAYGSASAVAMENWDTDYEPALQLCREKIRDKSTHYLGVLGYLRGFVPSRTGENAASITEIELECAAEHCGRGHMAIFVPKPHSQIAVELERRAAGLQTDAELDAQRAFLARALEKGTAQQFETPWELGGRVTRKIVIWARGGIRETARAAGAAVDAASRRRIPADTDLIEIGRQEQLKAFLDVFEAISVPEVKKAAAFLVHGPSGFGHLELLTRLARAVEDKAFAQPCRCVISAVVLWRESSCAGLIDAMGGEIYANWKPANIPEFATGLKNVLNERDVILQVSGVEGYIGGPAAFLAEFWRPLVDEVAENTPNRLICLASVETADLSADTSWPDHGTLDDEPYAGYVHVLPPLRSFTDGELSVWLRRWLMAAKADFWTGKLMARTKGTPQVIYAFLADPALWDQQAAPKPAESLPTRSLA